MFYKSFSAVYQEALNLIEEHGWTYGTARDPITGAYCLGGAVVTAVTGNPYDTYLDASPGLKRPNFEIVLPFKSYLEDNYLHNSIERWNDAEGRTIEDVKDVLRRAIVEVGDP